MQSDSERVLRDGHDTSGQVQVQCGCRWCCSSSRKRRWLVQLECSLAHGTGQKQVLPEFNKFILLLANRNKRKIIKSEKHPHFGYSLHNGSYKPTWLEGSPDGSRAMRREPGAALVGALMANALSFRLVPAAGDVSPPMAVSDYDSDSDSAAIANKTSPLSCSSLSCRKKVRRVVNGCAR